MKSKFATAINCIDGRVQAPVSEFIRRNYGIDYVDMVTLPGPDKVLSECKDIQEIESIKSKVLISCNSHGSKLIFIAGHSDCAGNPVREEEHCRQIEQAVQNIEEWNLEVDVYGIWVNASWEVKLI